MKEFFDEGEVLPGGVYVQCKLEHFIGDGKTVEKVAFIQEKLASLGEKVQFKENGQWDHGWVVMHVGTRRIGVPDTRRAIREHKKRTGDSLPKKPR